MIEVREAVDDGDGSLLVQLLQGRVAVHSGQNDVTETRQNPVEANQRSCILLQLQTGYGQTNTFKPGFLHTSHLKDCNFTVDGCPDL